MKTNQKGFTLVEIAIVLVIIGLLLGGILKGQEMITQAKIKNIISDFSGISAAFHGYQDRYRAIPGDDLGAAARWTTAPAATSGNGNGVVAGTYNNAGATCTTASESCLWWDHLRRSGFVAGSGVLQPLNALSGIIGAQTGDAAGGAALGADASGTGGFFGLMMCSANLPDKVAIATDTQMDDGGRLTGSVRGQLQTANNPNIVVNAQAAAAGGAGSYVESGTNAYTICRLL
ncbi:MAG: prepilin-type N-terminal cleavage/methylation domain-containing protein [Betaproteobacteria bacterium]|nr:prepilin-type N-terminal cleavage/methylation domain-containing protein [Betaproteobacteria bacterium]